MNRDWQANITCTISEGKAYLKSDLRAGIGCHGNCHSCSYFLGVDLTDTGKEHLKSGCAALANMPLAA